MGPSINYTNNERLGWSVLLTAGWYGEESDFRGRLFVLRIAPIGMIIYTSVTIMVAKYQSVVGIIPIFIAPIIKGVLAGEHIVFAAFQAYISDATNPRDRWVPYLEIVRTSAPLLIIWLVSTLYMSFMMASLYSGMTIGPIAGSWIIKVKWIRDITQQRLNLCTDNVFSH